MRYIWKVSEDRVVHGIEMNQIPTVCTMGQEMKLVPSRDFLRHLVVWGLWPHRKLRPPHQSHTAQMEKAKLQLNLYETRPQVGQYGSKMLALNGG